MDNLYNIQQLKDCFGQRTKFYILDVSKAITHFDKIGQKSDTIIQNLQAESIIQMKYTPMEGPTECNRREDNNVLFY